MKTQISRDSHRPEKRYSGVYQQQGRMITDADWNELMELVKHHLDTVLTDVVASGAPRGRAVELVKSAPQRPLRIKRGYAYADGVVARVQAADPSMETFRYDQQADFPAPPPFPRGGYIIYLDVWERAVISLEDPGLRDAALHGADTTTRTQTMAQAKWSEMGVDPEDTSENPQRGDAALTLILRKKTTEKDPCDPCAEEVGVQARTGNYLFRLEVHDVRGSFSAPDQLTLKWSSENGAEQHGMPKPPKELPPEFTTGDWIYELYATVSEKHLGVHLAPGFDPTRGQLEASLPAPLPDLPMVRRWDGYCVLKRSGNTWSLVEGWDRGVKLSTGGSANDPGHVDLGNNLQVKLDALTLNLTLKNRDFVAGDYWLAPGREAIHTTGDTLLAGALPLGIIHHYLCLGEVDALGKLKPLSTEDKRRLEFPPLTDIMAGDVGYDTECPSGLFTGSHDTVEKALNQICQMAARHIAYRTKCRSGLFDTNHDTVKKALDRVCEIAAKHVSYESTRACPDLENADTVQKALDILCVRPSGSSCRVTVGDGGEHESLEEAIKELFQDGPRDVCVCLLPGDHKVRDGLAIKDGQIRFDIVGCGSATNLKLESGALSFDGLSSVSLSEMEINRGDSRGLLITGCGDVQLRNLEFVGFAPEASPLLRISGARRILLVGNTLEARVKGSLNLPRRIVGPGLEALFADFNRGRFFGEVTKASTDLVRLPKRKRQKLAEEILRQVKQAARKLSGPEKRAFIEFSNALMAPKANAAQFAEIIGLIRVLTLAASGGSAVFVEDGAADTTIKDCEIVGRLQFYGSKPGNDLSAEESQKLARLIEKGYLTIEDSGPALQVRGNRLTSLGVGEEVMSRLRALIDYLLDDRGGVVNTDGVLGGIFGTGHMSDNTFTMPGSQFISGFLNLSANVFHLDERVGWAMAQSAVFIGNQAQEKAELINISAIKKKAANTLKVVP